MQPIIAELTVEDVDAAIFWYRGLGFEVDLEGLRDEEGLQWASLAHEDRTVWLLRADMSPHAADAAPRTTLYLQVADVDAFYAHVTGRAMAAESEPADQWYGLREFALRDPDGFRWVISQPLSEAETPPPPNRGALPGRF